MNELYDLVIELKNAIDDEDVIKKLISAYQEIYNDDLLMRKIKEFRENNYYLEDNDIIKNIKYEKMKHLEAELAFIILEINKNLKTIIKDEDL